MERQTLNDLLHETDALTYINSVKVTLSEIKNEMSQIEELVIYINQHSEKMKKLMRKADNQYRLIAKLVQRGETPFTTGLTVEEEIKDEEIEELMSNG